MQAFNKSGELVDPMLLKMAIGSLPQAFNMQVETDLSDPIRINISWDNDELDPGSRMKDELVAISLV